MHSLRIAKERRWGKRIKREVGHPGKHWMIGQMVMFFISLVFGFDHGAVFGCQLEFFLARNGCGH